MTTTSQKPPSVTELSARAADCAASKTVTGRMRFSECQSLLTELADFDEATDRHAQCAKSWLITCVLAAVALGILTVAVSVNAGELGFLPGIGLAAAVIGCIIMGCRYSRLSAISLANEFRLVLSPFLDEIREDIPPKARVNIALDVSGVTPAKIVKQGEIPPGRFDKVVETIYEDPWCSFQVDLVDGSRLQLGIHNKYILHDRRWTTRSRSGKTKWKRKEKWKKRVTVTAAISPDADALSWSPSQVDALARNEKVKLAEKKGAHVCRLVRRFKFSGIDTAPEDSPSPRSLVGMFMRLYKMLKDARAEPQNGYRKCWRVPRQGRTAHPARLRKPGHDEMPALWPSDVRQASSRHRGREHMRRMRRL